MKRPVLLPAYLFRGYRGCFWG